MSDGVPGLPEGVSFFGCQSVQLETEDQRAGRQGYPAPNAFTMGLDLTLDGQSVIRVQFQHSQKILGGLDLLRTPELLDVAEDGCAVGGGVQDPVLFGGELGEVSNRVVKVNGHWF